MVNFKELPYHFDKIGRTVIEDKRVLRVIEDPAYINLYKELLASVEFCNLFNQGLVETKILAEQSDCSALILEHRKIDFIIHPSEYTNKMFWEAAQMFIKLSLELYTNFGVLTRDSHPWNISFSGSKPVYFDFSSLYRGNKVTLAWLIEFEKYFAIPIRLASFSKPTRSLSQLYRREHLSGFGLKIMGNRWVKGVFNRKFRSMRNYLDQPTVLFKEILDWLDVNRPIEIRNEYWSNYNQSHLVDVQNPKTIKQKFVYEVLLRNRPRTVLDLAANKGYYARMASHLGAAVMAFDYEESTVDICRNEIIKSVSDVTTVLLNFSYPTPASGIGLVLKDSFTRFKSDIVLALGLIHHICLRQNIPVSIFCEICMNYSKSGVIIEYVDPNDIHVKNWDVVIPKDYNINDICIYMSRKFEKLGHSVNIAEEGVNRTFMYFHN